MDTCAGLPYAFRVEWARPLSVAVPLGSWKQSQLTLGRIGRVSRWREQWLSDLNNFLSLIVSPREVDAKSLSDAGHKLARLGSLLPTELLGKRLAIPSPFSHLDLTPNDVLRLGDIFVRRFPERAQPVLIVGLRTAGSYFAPLLRALARN